MRVLYLHKGESSVPPFRRNWGKETERNAQSLPHPRPSNAHKRVTLPLRPSPVLRSSTRLPLPVLGGEFEGVKPWVGGGEGTGAVQD
jgi:hypothetical protein